MKTSSLPPSLSEEIVDRYYFPPTGTEASSSGTSTLAEWKKIIDYKLLEWGKKAGTTDVDDLEYPSSQTISLAIQVAEMMVNLNRPAPKTVVLDGDGGLVFSLPFEGEVSRIHFWDDGALEFLRVRDGKVISRKVIS